MLSRQAEELGYELTDEELEEREVIETDYRKVADVPNDVRERLPTSFDIIGDVAIIRLDDDVAMHADKVGEALMRTFPRLRTVAWTRGSRASSGSGTSKWWPEPRRPRRCIRSMASG